MNAAVVLHTDELRVDEALVARMIAEQVPEYASVPVRRLTASGSSNSLFRLGDELLVRVPRQPGGSATILKEARWLPYLEDALSAGVPEVVAVGEPGHGYPEHWSVVRWIDGEHPTVATPDTSSRDLLARDLAVLVRELRDLEVPAQAREDAALRWYRAEPLSAIDSEIRTYAEQCRSVPKPRPGHRCRDEGVGRGDGCRG